jgi:hypothetical protein
MPPSTLIEAAKSDAARCFFDRSATPPRGDARRGIRLLENGASLGQLCLRNAEVAFFLQIPAKGHIPAF